MSEKAVMVAIMASVLVDTDEDDIIHPVVMDQLRFAVNEWREHLNEKHKPQRLHKLVIAGYKNEDGCWVDAKSSCCYARLQYYDAKENYYYTWSGMNPLPLGMRLRCHKCDGEVHIE